MKAHEIIDLGEKLGLPFNIKDNFPDNIDKDYVVFNGSNGQRFSIDGNDDDDKIYRDFGIALIQYGMRLKAMHINSVLSITGDSTNLPYHLTENGK